jgi:hypothetical protein
LIAFAIILTRAGLNPFAFSVKKQAVTVSS